jgi:ribonuclease Z
MQNKNDYITILGTGNAHAARLAERLQVNDLILYHTEDKTLETRKKRYTAEAESAYSGHVWVPDDLEIIAI